MGYSLCQDRLFGTQFSHFLTLLLIYFILAQWFFIGSSLLTDQLLISSFVEQLQLFSVSYFHLFFYCYFLSSGIFLCLLDFEVQSTNFSSSQSCQDYVVFCQFKIQEFYLEQNILHFFLSLRTFCPKIHDFSQLGKVVYYSNLIFIQTHCAHQCVHEFHQTP